MLIIWFSMNTCVEKIPTEYLVVEVPVSVVSVPVDSPLLSLEAGLGSLEVPLSEFYVNMTIDG